MVVAMSEPLPWMASILQGEGGMGYQGQLAVANVIKNRATQQGVVPMTIAVKPGQFIFDDPKPNQSAITLADMLENGTLSEDNTAGALFYVTPTDGASWGGIEGATGPGTAGIIGAGCKIGLNYFSDNWGEPSDFFKFMFKGGYDV
jgi:hypothetical protein